MFDVTVNTFFPNNFKTATTFLLCQRNLCSKVLLSQTNYIYSRKKVISFTYNLALSIDNTRTNIFLGYRSSEFCNYNNVGYRRKQQCPKLFFPPINYSLKRVLLKFKHSSAFQLFGIQDYYWIYR